MPELEAQIKAWFAGAVPADWFEGQPEVAVDREEIIVTGSLPDVTLEPDAGPDAAATARAARIQTFREETRGRRVRVAADAEHRFRRKVSWGAACGETRTLFTHLSIPVMTRLRQPERALLDTLVDAGVARTRSDALAWCVRLVGRNQAEWLKDLRDAFVHVERVRAQGPDA